MVTKSDWLAAEEAGHEFGDSTHAKPTALYIALLTAQADLGDTGDDLVEATSTGYSRKSYAPGSTRWSYNSTTRRSSNSQVITFDEMSKASPGEEIVAWALIDTASGDGNIKHTDLIRDSGGNPATILVNSLNYLVSLPIGQVYVQH